MAKKRQEVRIQKIDLRLVRGKVTDDRAMEEKISNFLSWSRCNLSVQRSAFYCVPVNGKKKKVPW
jgi:hypothetical protein